MKFGVPKENLRYENRVGLSPFGVSRLCELGHEVIVERGAGQASRFTDEDFSEAGAQVVYQADEIYARADVVCRISRPLPTEVELLRPGTVVCGLLSMGVASRELVAEVHERELTMLGYELVEDARGRRPLLSSIAEIASQMVAFNAANLLKHQSGGRGLVLGGITGIPPATVVILGAGGVGQAAAALFAAVGAHVIVLDLHIEKLREVRERTGGRANTALASLRHLKRYTQIADVLVGAVHISGGKAPYVVTREMVRAMKEGSVILDLSIDEGGCVETSRPTTLADPTFVAEGVIHYCVPNMTSNAPRITSRAVTMAAAPYLAQVAEQGLEGALRANVGLAKGLYFYRGKAVQARAAEASGGPVHSLRDLLSTSGS